ncbi:MAG TPA: ATP-binding protein [Bordetella sp.]|jgi:two-component system sensor histidine kinase BaeS|nr:ATP-binding protein [Bordetella sp.]
MRLGITFKLFLAILATSLTVTLAMGSAVRWNFERHFLSYVKERELRRVERMRQSLADIYRERGSWDALRGNASLWSHVLTVPASDPAARRHPPQHGVLEWLSELDPNLTPPPPSLELPPDADWSRGRDFLALPFTLLDNQMRVVAGYSAPAPGAPRRSVDVDGMTVGWLVTPFPNRLPSEADQRFQREQSEATWVIGMLAALLAAAVSIFLARIFLAPVRRLASATHRLSAGDYATRVNVTSADELGRLGQDFNRLAYTLERNEGLRREMVADISHELRTPLAVLRGEMEALQDGVRPFSPDALASLQAEVSLLSKLIDDLYELALADVGALSYRMLPVDVAGIAEQAVDTYRERFGARGLRVETDIGADGFVIEGDAQRLTQLMSNLLENTLRYTDPNGVVRVSVRAEGNTVAVECQDSAPGVPPQFLSRLFDRLFRVDPSRSRESGGAGLGLAICQRIVESHRGTIEAMPSELGGLRVRIVFPEAQVATS